MQESQHIIGNGSPKVAIIGSVHGDELIGPAVIKELRKLKVQKGTLGLFVAHPVAAKKKKRFITHDLNRVFPGKKSGSVEEKVAYTLVKKLAQFDIVIDIHGTSSQIDSLAIVTKLDSKTKQLLRLTPISKVALVSKKVFGGKELITHCSQGISLEYGPDKSAKRANVALRHVKILLKNLGVISGKKLLMRKKDFYHVQGSYPTPEKFVQNSSLKDFKLIKKKQQIGTVAGKTIVSKKDFYPLFLGKGKYPKTLALTASRKNIML